VLPGQSAALRHAERRKRQHGRAGVISQDGRILADTQRDIDNGVARVRISGAAIRPTILRNRGTRPGSGGTKGICLGRSGLLADAAIDPLAEQIGVAEVAGILLDYVEYHLAQRDGRAVLHRAADGEIG